MNEVTINRDGVTYEAVQCRFRADGCTAISSDPKSMKAHEARHELRRFYIKSFAQTNYYFSDASTKEQRAQRKAEKAKNRVKYCPHLYGKNNKECGREVYSLGMCRWHYYNALKTGITQQE